MAKKSYIWIDSDKFFAEMCENCHGQNGVGGEVKEAEPIGVHDVTEEFREGRAEPAIEEQREKGYPFGASSEAAAGSTLIRGCARVSVDQKR